MEKIMKFDIHIHTDMSGGHEIPRFNGERFASPEELRVMYNKLGIDRVLLPEVSPETYSHSRQMNRLMILLKNIPFFSSGSAILIRVWPATVLKPISHISLSIIKSSEQKASERFSNIPQIVS